MVKLCGINVMYYITTSIKGGIIVKKEVKGFIAGSLSTALLFTTAFAVFAEPIGKTITAFYNDIKIYVDGTMIQPKDAEGNKVEPFIYDGTTYLPVRAVSEALGKTVFWDGANYSIYISQSSTPKTQVVTVSTAEEFVKAIGSNKRIIMKPGVYDLSSVKQENNQNTSVEWMEVYDGKELNIHDVSNLTIEGASTGKTEIIVKPRYAQIMNFINSSNIVIKNIKAGHTPQEYECDAGVLMFEKCQDVSISNSELYGCGSVGLKLYETKNLICDNTIINHCSLRAVYIDNSESIKFTKSKIINHEAYANIIDISQSKDITFEECEIANNNHFQWGFIDLSGNSNLLINKCKISNNSLATNLGDKRDKVYFFKTLDYQGFGGGKIVVKDSEISNNQCDYLVDKEVAIVFENCIMNNNSWSK